MRDIFIKAILLFFLYLISPSVASSTDWTTYFENENILIEYQHTNCTYGNSLDQEWVMIQITNKKDIELIIEWQEQLWYDNNCINCEQEDAESRKKIIIKSNQKIFGECNINSNLKIFSKFTKKVEDMPIIGVDKIAELTRFELKNIIIN